ncbi:hypothetical protein IWW37_001887 [Coemansia sp. RSA 2050]|nr:hypothetical protein IWW37_001887 [Coemansia sp. RSA 2050]KAJ2734754.1 hypothetical protein IW152_002077 [Coemansia sp. BCRC 34962]
MSFSSKSLGLSSLDFGYSERAVHDALPPSSSPESAASGPPSPSPPLQMAYEQREADDCASLDGAYCSSDNLQSGELAPSDPGLDLWAAVVRTLGAPEPVCGAAIIAAPPTAILDKSADSSPFVVCGIDDLLLELGVDGAAFMADIDIPEELLLLPPTIPMLGADADMLSLREIDRFIEQLGHSHCANCIECVDYCEQPRERSRISDVPALLDTAAFVDCLENIGPTASIEPTAKLSLDGLCHEASECPGLDPSAAVTDLSYVGLSQRPLAPVLNTDLIIRQLGDVNLATHGVLQPPAKSRVPVLNVAKLVLELGKVATPELTSQSTEYRAPLDIVEVVEMLGNPASAVRIALARATATARPSLAKGLMRTPEPGTAVGLEGLGGVYTSEWMVHDMKQAGMVSEQILAEASATFNIFQFPQMSVQSNTQGPGESRMSAELSGSGMDVDEVIIDTRSRSSSMSLDHHDSAQYINRLIAALRIPPIVVSRPLLGPRRNMLFPRLI